MSLKSNPATEVTELQLNYSVVGISIGEHFLALVTDSCFERVSLALN